MKLLCTIPGRHGDILWSLPTLRAISETIGEPVDLAVADKYVAVCAMAEAQPYVGQAYGLAAWQVQETAPMTPAVPPRVPSGYDEIIHLGYEGWPSHPLGYEQYQRAQAQWSSFWPPLVPLSVAPWLTVQRWWVSAGLGPLVGVVFTDEWIELKAGVLLALANRFSQTRVARQLPPRFHLFMPEGGNRWLREYAGQGAAFPANVASIPCDLRRLLRHLSACDVVLACCSAGHVIAAGLGKPVILLEPNPQRHHPIFYPMGTEGPIWLVRGGDGLPSFDARHTGDLLEARLQEVPRE